MGFKIGLEILWFGIGIRDVDIVNGFVIKLRDRCRELEDFSFFKGVELLIIWIVFNIGLDTADTGYVWAGRLRRARASAFLWAFVSIVVLATTIAAEIEATATVFLLLRKFREFLGALLGSR